MSETNKAVIRRFMQEVWNANGDLAVADEILDAAYAASEKPFATIWRTAFPDLHATVDDLVAQGDKVTAVITFHGTHQHELAREPLRWLTNPLPPTGKQMDQRGICVLNWLARTLNDAQSIQTIRLANLLSNAIGFVFALLGQLAGVGGVNQLGWSTVAIYLLLTLGFAYFQFIKPNAV